MTAPGSSWGRQVFASPQHRRTTVVLVGATLLGVLFRHFGSLEFAADFVSGGTAAARWQFATAFFLLGIVPALLVRGVLREKLADYGVRLGDLGFAAKMVAILGPLLALSSFLASMRADFRAEYPLDPGAGAGAGPFALHAAAYLLLYYTAWEFCFRGFLLFGLRESLGDWNAILVQTSLSTALHVGKPLGETVGAIAGGILWGLLAFHTRSLLAGIVTHFILGISLDLFLVTT